MRYLILFFLLVVVIFSAGCVGESGLNLFKPTPTPIPPNYLNCNSTWYDSDYQTCCGNEIYSNQSGFVCDEGKYILYTPIIPTDYHEPFSTSEIVFPETLDPEEELRMWECSPQNGDKWIDGKYWSIP